MKINTIIIIFVFLLPLIFLPRNSISQEIFEKSYNYNYHTSTPYIYPRDSLVSQKLEWWKGIKFGFMITWGAYSARGITESWTLNSEDLGWNPRWGPHVDTIEKYREWYEESQLYFNPVLFDPDKWAAAAKYAGMKYVVFTTKHHDGFCMYNTSFTNYCVTNPKTPFSENPKANITYHIFNAFRNQGFGIGAYFSKPDWHNNNFWWKYFAAPDRNVNYSIKKYRERWSNYKDYIYNQVQEIVSGYGKLDILWLDGGWVNPQNFLQDLNMPRIGTMARFYQPGMIIVDRGGVPEYEDYRTPEKVVPDVPPDYPWETCMPMGICWAWVWGEQYKPIKTIINYLVEIVAKGGNFLLSTGVNPMGDCDTAVYNRLREIGDWMKVNSSAIYETNPVFPYTEGQYCFTKKADTIFVIYLTRANENIIPPVMSWRAIRPSTNSEIYMLGNNNPLSWYISSDGLVNVNIPKIIQQHPPCFHAWVFKIINSETSSIEQEISLPKEFKLYSNYPNPFNPVTEISFDVPKTEKISITIFDITGREVKKLIDNEIRSPGRYKITFNAKDLSSGTYFCSFKAGDNIKYTNKLILVK